MKIDVLYAASPNIMRISCVVDDALDDEKEKGHLSLQMIAPPNHNTLVDLLLELGGNLCHLQNMTFVSYQ